MDENEITHLTFSNLLGEGQLMATRCAQCDALYLPPRPHCPACHSDQLSWEALSGEGTLQAFTTVHIAPTAMLAAGYGRDNPYCTGIVRLKEGPAISAQILGVSVERPEEIPIGMPLRAKFVERGEDAEGSTSLAFEPAG